MYLDAYLILFRFRYWPPEEEEEEEDEGIIKRTRSRVKRVDEEEAIVSRGRSSRPFSNEMPDAGVAGSLRVLSQLLFPRLLSTCRLEYSLLIIFSHGYRTIETYC